MATKALAQVDQVIERHVLAPVDRGRPVGVLAGSAWIVLGDRGNDPLGQNLGVMQASRRPTSS